MLALLLMPLLCPAAHAGTWLFSCTGSGSESYQDFSTFYGQINSSSGTTAWVAPSPATGTSYSLPSFGYGVNPPGFLTSVSQNEQHSETVSITAKITITWTHGSGQTDASDPAPLSVMLIESSSASWAAQYEDGTPGFYYGSGGASDGLTPVDTAVPNYYGGVQNGGTSASANNKNKSLPPPHYITVPVIKGVVTLNRSFSASGSIALPNDGQQGAMNVGCSFDGYTVQIHPQPYNFRRTYFSNETPPTSVVSLAGELQFHYNWSSTDGVMGDLVGETIHENVDAPSSPTVTINGTVWYAPPPPFYWAPALHLDGVSVDATSSAGIIDDHSWGNGSASLSQCFVQKYVAGSFNLTQTYKFNDPATMATGVEQTVPGASGPITITDAVAADSNSPTGFSFTVTKSGTTSLPQPLP